MFSSFSLDGGDSLEKTVIPT